MLYRFQSKDAPDVLMLSDLTEKILGIVGKDIEKQGIFLVEQLPDAIRRLETAIERDVETRNQNLNLMPSAQHEYPKENDRLGQRAHPFLELLRKAESTQKVVTWSV